MTPNDQFSAHVSPFARRRSAGAAEPRTTRPRSQRDLVIASLLRCPDRVQSS
jgi:hypothetical protein